MNQETINMIIKTILIPLIVAIGGLLVAFIKNKSDEISSKVKNENIKKHLTYATDVISQVVDSVSQTYVDALKKENAFTKDKQLEAFEKATNKIHLLLTDATKNTIIDIYGDINIWIESKIESLIAESKKVY